METTRTESEGKVKITTRWLSDDIDGQIFSSIRLLYITNW